jgi:hypothetical protein
LIFANNFYGKFHGKSVFSQIKSTKNQPGADAMILKIFSPKKLAFLTQNTAEFSKNWLIALVFKKNAHFCFTEN